MIEWPVSVIVEGCNHLFPKLIIGFYDFCGTFLARQNYLLVCKVTTFLA